MPNLTQSKVRVEKGELLVIHLPNERTKAVGSCPMCASEIKVIRLPGTVEILNKSMEKNVLYHCFHCDQCEHDLYWDNQGKEMDKSVLNIKKKEKADD